MGLKCLFLNIPYQITPGISDYVIINFSTTKDKPTLHDFHAIIMDTDNFLNKNFWADGLINNIPDARVFSSDELKKFSNKVKEQIETGGVVFLFCGRLKSSKFYVTDDDGSAVISYFNNYLSSPMNLGVVSELGDTFYPKYENLKYFNSLIKKFLKEDITWGAYFSKLPDESNVLGANRAGYTVFAEIPIGNGKLVVLPRFKDMQKALSILVAEVLPQMIHEDTITFMPKWLDSYCSDFERRTLIALGDIEKTKRLLYTKDKLLKKAVAFAFEKLGFSVTILPDGTNPDLEISSGKAKVICEVKGHENRQSNRDELLQLLGYSTPEGQVAKSIFVSNHEFCKNPEERKKEGFTEGAVLLGECNKFSLITSTDLYHVVMEILQGKFDENSKIELRQRILNGVGIVHLC